MAGGLCYYCSTQRTYILLEPNQAHSQATLSNNDHSAVCSQAHERHSATATRAKCGGCGRVREYVQPFASTHHITHPTPSSRAINEPRFVHRYHDARYTTTRTHARAARTARRTSTKATKAKGEEERRARRTKNMRRIATRAHAAPYSPCPNAPIISHRSTSTIIFLLPSLALALSSSMGPKPRRPAHQNKVAFHHNKNSKKTKVILSLPNEGLCRKCHEVIEWKKAYRKYKPLTQPKKWCEQQPLHLLVSNPVASMEGGCPPRSVIQFDRSRELTAANAFARSFVVVCRAADGRYAVRITYSVTRVPRRISRAASASPRHRSLRTSRAARLSLCMCLCAHFQVCHFPSVGKRSRRRNDRSERWPRSSC